jgi:hypothetical protein
MQHDQQLLMQHGHAYQQHEQIFVVLGEVLLELCVNVFLFLSLPL